MPKIQSSAVASTLFNLDGLNYGRNQFQLVYNNVEVANGLVDESTIQVGLFSRYQQKYLVQPTQVNTWTNASDIPYSSLDSLITDIESIVGFEMGESGGGAGTPAGADGEIQYNSSGAFGATSNLFWDNTNTRLGVGNNTPITSIDTDGEISVGDGAAALPSLNFKNSASATGLALVRANTIGVVLAATTRWSFDSSFFGGESSFTPRLRTPGDTVNPTFTWRSDIDTGMLRDAADVIALVAGGNKTLKVRSTIVEVDDLESFDGVILTSPDTTRWKITVDNAGLLVTTSL